MKLPVDSEKRGMYRIPVINIKIIPSAFRGELIYMKSY